MPDMANEQTEESSTHQFPRRTARRPRSRPAPGTSTWRHPVLRPTCSFRPSCRSWEGPDELLFGCAIEFSFLELSAKKFLTFWNFQRNCPNIARATRDQKDRRRVSAVRASQTPGFEYVVRDGAFSARADFQPVPRGLTPRPCYAPSKMRARCGSGKRENDINARYGNYQMRMTSSHEIIKYKSLTSSVGRKQHNVA